ncbi:MAG: hypothetical protein ABJN38_12410 [Lentilitoribacter sp.]
MALKMRMTIRGIPIETVNMIRELREHEGRFIARILEDAVYEYWDAHHNEEEDDTLGHCD